MAFPDSSSVLDKVQSAILRVVNLLRVLNLLSHCAIAARLVRTPFSRVFQTFFLSKKGPRRSKYGGGGQQKHYGVVIHNFCYRRSIFSK